MIVLIIIFFELKFKEELIIEFTKQNNSNYVDLETNQTRR